MNASESCLTYECVMLVKCFVNHSQTVFDMFLFDMFAGMFF